MISPVVVTGVYRAGLYDRWMAPPELERMSLELVGRERECAAIDGLLQAAGHGESSSLVLRGEAGIGKTAPLSYASERARSSKVLRTVGVEAESDLAFAGLYGLLRPMVDKLSIANRRAASAALPISAVVQYVRKCLHARGVRDRSRRPGAVLASLPLLGRWEA